MSTRTRFVVVAGALAAAVSCASPSARGPAVVAAPITVPVVAPAGSTDAGPSPATAPQPIVAHAPPGYVEVQVLRVVPYGDAASVELGAPPDERVLRMVVGGTEGHSLLLRREKRASPRPLTHDLFDHALRELDAEIVQAQIDDLRDGTFIGTLVLKQEDRLVTLDARPSDAIALAIGARAPIYVAERVLAESAASDDANGAPAPAP